MATATLPSAPASAPGPDERVGRRNPFQKLLGRPEVGALVGAVVLFIFFSAVSSSAAVVPPRLQSAMNSATFASPWASLWASG